MRIFNKYGKNTPSSRLLRTIRVHKEYLEAAPLWKSKWVRGKPGIGGHLPVPRSQATYPNQNDPRRDRRHFPRSHHDIYSIEDLRQLVCSLKEAPPIKSGYRKNSCRSHVAAIARVLPFRRRHHRHRRLQGRYRRSPRPDPGQRGISH
jgi:hypothetical protein